MSIGQGYTLATPLHIANMMAMVANGGVIYKPHLLKEIREKTGVAGSGELIEKETGTKPGFIVKEIREKTVSLLAGEAEERVIEKVEVKTPEPLFESDVPGDVWKQVQNYLRYTITNGTAQFPLQNRIVAIAGKTGTAEVAGYVNQWHSWFVAYAPFDAPPEEAYVVCVLVEAANPWEWWAPYASNIILQGIFARHYDFDKAVDELGFRYLTRPAARRE
jgi:penicillin-binding protein 2